MKLLLDTHAFLWFVWGDAQLSTTARQTIEDPNNDLLLSSASYWEIAIKVSLGKLGLTEAFQKFIEDETSQNDVNVLDVSIAHANELISLPFHHRDPFDRMLVAQAQVEQLDLVRRDQVFDSYGVTRLW